MHMGQLVDIFSSPPWFDTSEAFLTLSFLSRGIVWIFLLALLARVDEGCGQ
uniref:Uncharacterized protein n=1 Tax=Anguilla anguilla TaxID=7936 RepID=A0A0E9PCT9_ANGAN